MQENEVYDKLQSYMAKDFEAMTGAELTSALSELSELKAQFIDHLGGNTDKQQEFASTIGALIVKITAFKQLRHESACMRIADDLQALTPLPTDDMSGWVANTRA